MSYDSRPDTYEHIAKVRGYLLEVAHRLTHRAHRHDATKLANPEKALFDEYTPKLAQIQYGTPEYEACRRAMGPALEHHYRFNDHHPEHFSGGFADMDLLQVIEMLCDWEAAGERMEDGGDILRSIRLNAERFGYGPEITKLTREHSLVVGLPLMRACWQYFKYVARYGR